MIILNKKQIAEVLPQIDLLGSIERGLVEYSKGNCVVPPVGELLLDKGEVHIKYGCIRGERFYVIKVASGFYQNPSLGLPSSNGLMQLFEQETGQLAAILLDEGMLTDIRTAIAGAVCAKYLAPENIECIGILGTGTQARLQAEYTSMVTGCKKLVVWGRSHAKLREYRDDMQTLGFEVETTDSISDLCQKSRLIITTTPSHTPLILADWVQPGTHITAMGSDTPDKQELDAELLARAELVVADSIEQCQTRGEISKAVKQGVLSNMTIKELGMIISDGTGRSDNRQITIADLTGVAVQDIKIAESVYLALT